jgi:steroid delta-isomerase-like uncharacterized protein
MTNANRDLAVRWFEEVWNQGRRDAVEEMLSPDAVVHDGPVDSRGPAGFYAFYDRMHAAFSDVRIKPDITLVEGDLVCIRWTATMKHTGDGLGMPATGKAVQITGTSIIRVAGGKLVEGWQNWDMLGMIEQIRGTGDRAPTYMVAGHH